MRHWKKYAAAAALAALLLGLLAPASGAAEDVYLMAVNDRVLVQETTVDNIPRAVGGVLYVPYIMLSYPATGIDLGVSALYSATKRTVLVTDGQRAVTFDLQAGSAQDLNGASVPARAMVRNSTVFLPIDWLCEYFGSIACTRTRTQYGTLIRVSSPSAALSDREFVDAADNLLSSSLQRYQASVGSSGGGGEDGPAPSEEPLVSDPPSGAELYLALRWGAEAEDCARLLENRGLRGLFLFSPEEARAQDGLVRRLVGAGHTVGLALSGEDVPACLEEAEEGRAALAAAARYNALAASADSLDRAGRKELAQAGYALWTPTVLGRDYSSGKALAEGLNARRVNYVEMSCGSGGAAFLRAALSAMEEEQCQIYLPTAPALSPG